MPNELVFGAPSQQFLQKHGNLYCACCKRVGSTTQAAFMPLGWPKSVVFKREFASCAKHLEETKGAARRRLEVDRQDDYESEGEHQVRQRFRLG